jgi:hypothetical protein
MTGGQPADPDGATEPGGTAAAVVGRGTGWPAVALPAAGGPTAPIRTNPKPAATPQPSRTARPIAGYGIGGASAPPRRGHLRDRDRLRLVPTAAVTPACVVRLSLGP